MMKSIIGSSDTIVWWDPFDTMCIVDDDNVVSIVLIT